MKTKRYTMSPVIKVTSDILRFAFVESVVRHSSGFVWSSTLGKDLMLNVNPAREISDAPIRKFCQFSNGKKYRIIKNISVHTDTRFARKVKSFSVQETKMMCAH